MSPLITVMIPCYNTGEALRETLESVIQQSYSNWEIVAVDDASRDNTGMILDEYASKYPGKIRVIHNQYENGKKTNSFNVGWTNSRGDWLVDLGHDDLLDPDFMMVCLKRLEESGADAIVPRLVHFVDSANIPEPQSGGLKGDLTAVISGREAVMLSLDWQINSFCLWRGSIARSTHIDEDDTPYDWGELESRRRFMRCDKVAFSKGEYRYRYNPTSITHVAWGRNSHKRLVTNRELLSDMITGHYPSQVIDSYRIATYRLFCASCSRFAISKLRRTDKVARREVGAELREYYDDVRVLDKKVLAHLMPTLLDRIRLRFFWAVVPISFWRKFINRLFRNSSIF